MTEREYPGPDSRQIREMFAGIAHRYDFLNHFLSASVDRRWRKIAVNKVRQLAGASPAFCFDVCSGTGDLAIALEAGLNTRVIASDFCHPMQIGASAKSAARQIQHVEAGALDLPIATASIDALTIASGLRNLEDPYRELQETHRIWKAGGAQDI